MPELRKDPILDRWIVISEERGKRPKDFKEFFYNPKEEECSFCRGKDLGLEEVYSLNDQMNNWLIKVVADKDPLFITNSQFSYSCQGPYKLASPLGRHEIIIETPQHISNMADLSEEQISLVFKAYRERMKNIILDERIKSVIIFKNQGWQAGGSNIAHSHSQLIAKTIIPKKMKEQLVGAQTYYQKNQRCVYCDMFKQELDDTSRLIVQEDDFLAFIPFAPSFPFDIWLMPKRHDCNFYQTSDQELTSLARTLKAVLSKINRAYNKPAYNYIIHTAPSLDKDNLGQIPNSFHWYIEISPRITKLAGFEWGTGFYICSISPEEIAKNLKNK